MFWGGVVILGGEIGLERGKASGPAAAGCGGRRGLNCGVRLPAPPQPNPTACYLLQGDSHAVGSPEPIPWEKKSPPLFLPGRRGARSGPGDELKSGRVAWEVAAWPRPRGAVGTPPTPRGSRHAWRNWGSFGKSHSLRNVRPRFRQLIKSGGEGGC